MTNEQLRFRKMELMEYIELLMNLSNNGVNCKQEINQALKELHELMIPERGVIGTNANKDIYADSKIVGYKLEDK